MDTNTKKELREQQKTLVTQLNTIVASLQLPMEIDCKNQMLTLYILYLVFPETTDWKEFTIPLFLKKYTMEEFAEALENTIRVKGGLDDSAIFLYRRLNKTEQRLSAALHTTEQYYATAEALLAKAKATAA